MVMKVVNRVIDLARKQCKKGLAWAAGYATGARLEVAHLLGGVTAMEAWEQVRVHKIQTTSMGSLDGVGSVGIDHTVGLVGSHHSEMDARVCCATLCVSGVCVDTLYSQQVCALLPCMHLKASRDTAVDTSTPMPACVAPTHRANMTPSSITVVDEMVAMVNVWGFVDLWIWWIVGFSWLFRQSRVALIASFVVLCSLEAFRSSFMALALAEAASRLTLNAHVVQPMDMFALSTPNSNPCPQWHHTAVWRWSTAS